MRTVCRPGLLLLLAFAGLGAFGAGKSAIDPNFVVFGYIQSSTPLSQVRWNALTHVGGVQIYFNSSGNLIDSVGNATTIATRDGTLKAGGAAQAAGVKFVPVITSFDDNSGGVIETVMTDYTANGPKSTLITNIVNGVTTDGYCAGVNFDLEFSWGSASPLNTTVRDGIADFLQKLRTALPSQYEISFYVNASYHSYQWPAAALNTYCDYVLQSGYDWATGVGKVHAITDQDANESAFNGWFAGGVAPEKMVYTISTYGFTWTNATGYGGSGTQQATGYGFTDYMYDTNLRTGITNLSTGYQTGDEGPYYTYNNAGTTYTACIDNEYSLEYKMRSALSFHGAGNYLGRRMKGIGFWSLAWMEEASGYDPLPIGSPGGTATSSNNMRTYPHIYELTEEIFAPAGTTKYIFEKFESQNPHWDGFTNGDAGNRRSPDNTNVNYVSTARSIVAMPTGTGSPTDSTNAMKLDFAFSSTTGKIFIRHEVLNSSINTSVVDKYGADAVFSTANKLNAYVYNAAAYAGVTVRMVVLDKNRELEASPQFALTSTGWHTFTWDLTDTTAGNINALTTAEPSFVNGDGALDTSGDGVNDIGFVGFLVERNSGSSSGSIYFDELSYEPTTPSGKQYKLNEFRYNNVAQEFVEIYGPSGAFPSGMELRFYNSADGSILSSVALNGQSIPASGLFVVGDPSLGANYTPSGWTAAANNIPNTLPSGIQLYDSTIGAVYDSVVYGAMQGSKQLIRREDHRVTNEGPGWIGETGSGGNSSGVGLSFGRYPNSVDTDNNEADFSLMPATIGTANGGSVSLPVTFDFSSAPANAYKTYQNFSVQDPTAAGLTGLSGNAHRCIDTTGGGSATYFGDAALGADGQGYNVTGSIYVPAATDPAQSLGLGLCVKQGSNFFSSTSPNSAGYESGYWLIYENGTTNLNDDQANHSGQFQFVYATNDAQDGVRTAALGTNKSLANVGITLPANGQWVSFRLSINPAASDPNGRLLAQINGVDVYKGSIPSGGPTSGAFSVGFRDAGTGAISNAREGTWVDSISINTTTVPVQTSRFELY